MRKDVYEQVLVGTIRDRQREVRLIATPVGMLPALATKEVVLAVAVSLIRREWSMPEVTDENRKQTSESGFN